MSVLVYENRIEALRQQDFDARLFQKVVLTWLLSRPPLLPTNKDLDFVKKRILEEIGEIQDDIAALDTEKFNNHHATTEWGDIGWFIYGFITLNKFPLDDLSIRARLNGYGGRSDVYEVMEEITGNMSEKSLINDLHHLIPIWISVLASFPEYIRPDLIIKAVFQKNKTNYPADAFSGNIMPDRKGSLQIINPFTGKVMSKEELSLAYEIPKKALRMIRDFQIIVLGRNQREEHGLKTEDFMPYLEDVLYFLNFTEDLDQSRIVGENSLKALYTRLHLDNNIPLGTLKLRQ